jgi:hypothetical protein
MPNNNMPTNVIPDIALIIVVFLVSIPILLGLAKATFGTLDLFWRAAILNWNNSFLSSHERIQQPIQDQKASQKFSLFCILSLLTVAAEYEIVLQILKR